MLILKFLSQKLYKFFFTLRDPFNFQGKTNNLTKFFDIAKKNNVLHS